MIPSIFEYSRVSREAEEEKGEKEERSNARGGFLARGSRRDVKTVKSMRRPGKFGFSRFSPLL